MNLVSSTDPILVTPTKEWDFDNPPEDSAELAMEMVNFMRDHQGIGLAANQVGKPYRVFAMEGEPARVCFNPRIVNTSQDSILLEEGCLSFPGLIVKVKRPTQVRIRFTGPNGEIFTEQFIGMTARVIQHEMDHLDGIRFFDRATRFHRDQAFRQLERLKRKVSKGI